MAAQKRTNRGINRLTEDCDYLEKLPEAEREWMINFLRAWSDCSGPMVEEVAEGFTWTTNGRLEGKAAGEESGRKALNRKHYATRTDVFTHHYSRVNPLDEEKNLGRFGKEE